MEIIKLNVPIENSFSDESENIPIGNWKKLWKPNKQIFENFRDYKYVTWKLEISHNTTIVICDKNVMANNFNDSHHHHHHNVNDTIINENDDNQLEPYVTCEYHTPMPIISEFTNGRSTKS
ncbi:hypothetical protein HUG17_7079 [Dermatophagoides farinae]|uniref:Uncharacterized protein n=1 Tax=Dermatophagoides farinae TaxID=6954 RepID=A0A9D4NRK1_DERFA|nr:hypothetical protein HUG17_7079 [Dermatophagoides farinae]